MASIETPGNNPRSERFGYTCNRCLKCCYHKRIQLNPYEVARLARNRGMPTSEFRSVCTEDGKGLFLAQTESGACIFLGSEGCTVHADRPLVCRLYPLGRIVNADRTESFRHVQPHPESHGVFGHSSTIADFLEAQGAYPFMRAADDYYFWLCAASDHFDAVSNAELTDVSAADEATARDLIDMDTAIARYCAANGAAEPTDIEARRELHLTVLYQELHRTIGGSHDPASQEYATEHISERTG